MGLSRFMEYEILIGMGFMVLLVVGVAVYVAHLAKEQKRIAEEGIEAEGTVSIEVIKSGDDYTTYYYVTYKTIEGELIEKALIGNFNPFNLGLREGDRIKLKYLEKDPKYVRFIEKIETPTEETPVEEDPFEW